MTQHLSLDDSLLIPDEVIARELGGEMVILNLQSGIYFGLDEIGSALWELIRRHASLRKVWELASEEYDVEPGVLETDLLRLAEDLRQKGLVQPVTPASK